jgi:hypothetical protein
MANGQKTITIITTGMFCFAAGAGAGIAWMIFTGYKPKKNETPQMPPSIEINPPPIMLMPLSHAGHLGSLIATLDNLTGKPLTIDLTDEQRTRIATELEGLEWPPTEIVAMNKLSSILSILERDRETLETVGFRYPITDVTQTMPDHDLRRATLGANVKHLNSLREKLTAK